MNVMRAIDFQKKIKVMGKGLSNRATTRTRSASVELELRASSIRVRAKDFVEGLLHWVPMRPSLALKSL
jgi:hypothetical protein